MKQLICVMIMSVLCGLLNGEVALSQTTFVGGYSAPGPPPNLSTLPKCLSGQIGYVVEWLWPVWGTYPGGPAALPSGWIYLGPSAMYRFVTRKNGSLATSDLICQLSPVGQQVTVK